MYSHGYKVISFFYNTFDNTISFHVTFVDIQIVYQQLKLLLVEKNLINFLRSGFFLPLRNVTYTCR